MDKEEILKRAREENKGVDEVKCAAENEAAKISMAIGLAVCMLLNFLDSILLHTDAIGDACWIIYGTMVASRLWVYAGCLKKSAISLVPESPRYLRSFCLYFCFFR